MSDDATFQLEKEMTPIVADWLRDQGFTVMFERMMTAGWYADIVAVEFDEQRAQERIDARDATAWGAPHKCAKKVVNPPSWYPVHKRVWAIELKLSKWKWAIKQAAHYTAAACRGYVALPVDKTENDALLDRIVTACDQHGVGLLAVDKDGVHGLHRAEYLPRPMSAGVVVNTVEKAWKVYKSQR